MKIQKLLISAASAGLLLLLLGGSGVMARVVDAWVVVGLESSSGQVDLGGTDLCMVAVSQLSQMGFEFKAMTQLESRIAALFFQKTDDAVTLFCLANIFEEQSGLFGEEIQ